MAMKDPYDDENTLWQQYIPDSQEEQQPDKGSSSGDGFRELHSDVFKNLDADSQKAGGLWNEPPEYHGSIGRTMFDTPSSEDNSVTVLLPRESIEMVPAQSLVRIRSLPDDRFYLGVVIEGPFAEPDGIRGDAAIVVTTTVKGGIFMPKFHGRVQVELLGEELEGKGGTLVPPRFRPLPNSPVFVLDSKETAQVLSMQGDILFGMAVGHEDLEVRIPSHSKSVLSRHLGVLGTTGRGKSTTVSGLVSHLQQAEIAVILIDAEGEYTLINEATAEKGMLAALERRGLSSAGVEQTFLHYLVGRETTNPHHPRASDFCLTFAALSPHLVCELLELTEPQEQRYLKAYDITKRILYDLKISPKQGEDTARFLELDEMEEGYPGMQLSHIYDIIQACAQIVDKAKDNIQFYNPDFKQRREIVIAAIDRFSDGLPGSVPSWRALQGKLGRIRRLNIFDNRSSRPLNYHDLLQPGRVSIIDLSDTDAPRINNLVIAELLILAPMVYCAGEELADPQEGGTLRISNTRICSGGRSCLGVRQC